MPKSRDRPGPRGEEARMNRGKAFRLSLGRDGMVPEAAENAASELQASPLIEGNPICTSWGQGSGLGKGTSHQTRSHSNLARAFLAKPNGSQGPGGSGWEGGADPEPAPLVRGIVSYKSPIADGNLKCKWRDVALR